MYRNLVGWLITILILPACSKHTPNISVVCEENNVGNCIIKWETAPVMQGKIRVYASLDPTNIPENIPVAIANIQDQRVTIITTDPANRYYYLMVFNDKYRIKVATRNINITGIQNFRDLGGYKTSRNKLTRWGKLYRSAQIDSLNSSGYKELKNIGIKTIIDFRCESELTDLSPLQVGFNRVHIPIATGDMENILKQLQEGKMKSDTIYKIIQQMNRELVANYKKEYQKMFDVLLDASNYPAVIHCSSGKGRTGVASALILSALSVNAETIMRDYRLSNDYFNIPKASKYAYNLPANSQEAITTVFSAQEDFLNAAREEIEKESGNIPTYLKNALKLSDEKIARLEELLLE